MFSPVQASKEVTNECWHWKTTCCC